MGDLLVTSADMGLYRLDIETRELNLVIKKAGKRRRTMGIARLDDFLFIADNFNVFKYEYDEDWWGDGTASAEVGSGLHHMSVHDGNLLVADTRAQGFHIVTPDLDRVRTVKSGGKWINAVQYYKGHYYLCNAQYPTREKGSGVIVLDEDFEEVERFQMGWEAHGFKFIDDRTHILCSAGRASNRQHPSTGGLMVEGEFVFEYEENVFCKEVIKHEDKFYVFGGATAARENRGAMGGIIFILDENYKQIDKLFFKDIGELVGCAAE